MTMRPSQLRNEYLKYIDEHKFLPDYLREPLKEIVSSTFQTLSRVVGTTELIHRRATDK